MAVGRYLRASPPSEDEPPSPFVHAVLIPSLILVVAPFSSAFIFLFAFPNLPFYTPFSPELYMLYFINPAENASTAGPTATSLGMATAPFTYNIIFEMIYLTRYGTRFTEQFKKSPSKILITLYEVLNLLLIAQILILIVITVLHYSIPEELRNTVYAWPILGKGFYLIQNMLILNIYLLYTYLALSDSLERDYHFMLAQKCMREATRKKDDQIEKIKYVIDGLSSYNRYLKRNLGLQFDDTRISSSIICSPSDKNQIVDKMEKSFSEKPDDKLKPVACLSKIAKLQPHEQFLRRIQLSTKIKEISYFLAAIIPALITVIQFAFPKQP